LVLFITRVILVTLSTLITLYVCGSNINLHASLHIFFDAAQQPPPLHELDAHVVPQHPLLQAVLHLAKVDFLFSHPTFHDFIWNARLFDLGNNCLHGIESLHSCSNGSAASSCSVTVTFT